MEAKIKVAIVDDQHLFRKGLVSLIKEFDELDVIIEASGPMELLSELKTQTPDIIVVDYKMPLMNGLETSEVIREKYPQIKLLLLTMFKEDDLIEKMVEKGVNGFLLKGCDIDTLVDAIHKVIKKGFYFNEHFSREVLNGIVRRKKNKRRGGESSLSRREIEIIKLLCKEYTNREIAEKLFISSRTVDGHRTKILQKTNSKNITGVVLYAIKNDLLD